MSSEAAGRAADVAVAVDVATNGDAGVPEGALLRRFALAAVQGDADVLAAAREALSGALGPEALAEAAGVVAQFESINRIADATGIALDESLAEIAPAVFEGIDLEPMRQT